LYVPTLARAEPRLQRRYHHLIVSQLCSAQRLAAGVHAPATGLAKGFATTQAAWRFYSNEDVTLAGLCVPLVEHACSSVKDCCDQWVLVINDWSNLHYNQHESKHDRVALAMNNDLGYELFTALAVSDRDGSPMASLCLELRAGDGLHTTRGQTVQKPNSPLDGLEPVMDHITAMPLGKPVVFIIDREADSVAHYRRWDSTAKKFIIRSDDSRLVLHGGREQPLAEVVNSLGKQMKLTRPVQFKAKAAQQFIAETTVVLTRPAYQHRVDKRTGKKKHKVISGPALSLRLVVAPVRAHNGKVLACWMLLSNLPSSVSAATIALWYYWRWRIESYHKLLKSAGQQIESWRQETAAALARRLLVTAMSAVLVWQIARDATAQAQQLRETLVKLSGRQIKRGKTSRGFTEPALLAGLNVLIPIMTLLESMTLEDLKAAAHHLMPLIKSITRPPPADSG
jgi:hypothetical protein